MTLHTFTINTIATICEVAGVIYFLISNILLRNARTFNLIREIRRKDQRRLRRAKILTLIRIIKIQDLPAVTPDAGVHLGEPSPEMQCLQAHLSEIEDIVDEDTEADMTEPE